MSFFSVDVESDGPCPGLYSLISLGAVLVKPGLRETFHLQACPISNNWEPEALAISNITREEHLTYPLPGTGMQNFAAWIKQVCKGHPIFVSDNNGFDWQFVNYYFHAFHGSNPFGFSSRRIGDLYCGLEKNSRAKWKHLRDTPHTHHPVDDAKGNAEVLLKMKEMGLHFDFE